VIKVEASDEKGNLKGEALTEEAESEAVVVDNTRPDVTISSRTMKMAGAASDATSHIVRLEVQIDGGAWKPIPCKDGLFDSGREEWEFDVAAEKLPKGTHVISVRAFDQEMNVGVATAAVSVP
jgi:hypothetical protein